VGPSLDTFCFPFKHNKIPQEIRYGHQLSEGDYVSIYKDKNDWPYESDLDIDAIKTRVDLARLAVYNMVVGSSNPDRIHIEDILNVFLSLVQHPLNFAFLDESYNCIFHMCRDPKHKSSFQNYIEKDVKWDKSCTYKVFTQQNSEREVYLAIVHMNTKGGNNYSKVDYFPDESKDTPFTESEYISICARMFFEEKWDSMKSAIYPTFIESVIESISEMEVKYKNEKDNDPGVGVEIIDEYEKNTSEFEREFRVQDILNHLSNTMAGIRNSSVFVNRMSSNMNYLPSSSIANQILAFRDYDVSGDYKRYNGHYDYCTRYVLSEKKDIIEQYDIVLNDLKRNYSDNPDSYNDPDSGRVRYSEISVTGDKKKFLIGKIDDLFWTILASGKYSTRYILKDILADPVGPEMRSLVDPTYQTGLIHFNRIFEEAGLDRIDDRVIEELSKIGELELNYNKHKYVKDLLRIVILYYLISHIVRKSSKKKVDPQDILCVIYPIKIRGVCWAVAVHPYVVYKTQLDYRSDKDEHGKRHGEQFLWISIFVLTIYMRRRQFTVIDRACWGYSSRFITDQVNRCIGEFLFGEKDAMGILDDLNHQIEQVSSYLPYSFPVFDLNDKIGRKTGEYQGHIEITSDGTHTIWLTWDIEENVFYTPSQKWDRVSTRRFDDAIKHAVSMARREFQKKLLSEEKKLVEI